MNTKEGKQDAIKKMGISQAMTNVKASQQVKKQSMGMVPLQADEEEKSMNVLDQL